MTADFLKLKNIEIENFKATVSNETNDEANKNTWFVIENLRERSIIHYEEIEKERVRPEED